jgi:hypothetical protein
MEVAREDFLAAEVVRERLLVVEGRFFDAVI